MKCIICKKSIKESIVKMCKEHLNNLLTAYYGEKK